MHEVDIFASTLIILLTMNILFSEAISFARNIQAYQIKA